MRALPVCLALLGTCAAGRDGLAEYDARKAMFLERQRRMRSDQGAVRNQLSEVERRADAVLGAMRHTLRGNMSGVLATPLRAVKADIQSTRLFAALHAMPKGAALHVHTDTMLSLDLYLQNVTYRPHCYVYWNKPAVPGLPIGAVKFFPSDAAAPEGWEAAASLRGRVHGFDAALLKHWDVFRGRVAFDALHDPWGPFQTFFGMLDPGYLYRPFFEDYWRLALLNAVDNWKTDYVEIRAFSYGATLYDLEKTYTMAESLAVFRSVVDAVKAARPHFAGAAVIYSQYRGADVATIWASLEEAYQMTQQFPGLVVGYDLVGQEDAGHSLSYLMEPLLAYAGKLAYFFHAGETDQSGAHSTAMNLNDAVLLGSKRIGHGLAMAKLPLAAEYAALQDIVVEINLMSNQGLEFVLDARNHPGAALLAQGVPLVICNDDPAILGTTDSMAYDWFVAYMAWDVDLASLKQFALNSIRYSAAAVSVKDRLASTFLTKWDSWAARVAATA